MFGLGTQELLVILLIAFFIFGGKKLPEIGAGLGKGLRSFKQGLSDLDPNEEPTSTAKQDAVEEASSGEKAA